MIPAHKQTDPNKKPGQIVNPVSGRKEDTTLGDYINRKYRDEAFSAVAQEKKLTFKQWLKKSSFVEPDETIYWWLEECWQAAQENV